jgi:hypothetical protein
MSDEHKIKAEELLYIMILINTIQNYLNKATYFSLVFYFLHALCISEVYTYYLQVLHLQKRLQLIIQGKALNIQALITNRNCNDYGASTGGRVAKTRIENMQMNISSTVVDSYSPTAKTLSLEAYCSLAVKWRWIIFLVVHIKYCCRTTSCVKTSVCIHNHTLNSTILQTHTEACRLFNILTSLHSKHI